MNKQLMFTMQLRGEMVAVSLRVYQSRGTWYFEEEYVLGWPDDQELTNGERANLQQAALCFLEA